MLRFIVAHPRILSFGLLTTLFSSFGQTFLISIFVPQLLESFGLSTAAFGTLYAAATLTSACCLPFFGRLIDRLPLARFSLVAGLGLGGSCLLMASATHVAVFFVALIGLRLTGQGLLSLTASTTMARVFPQGRGKALSVSALGYPLGEGLLPLAVVLMIHAFGWRTSWMILGLVILLVFLPATQSLLQRNSTLGETTGGRTAAGFRPPALLRDPLFLLVLPANLFLPLVLTALFLYQIPLAESRSWQASTMASAFVGFAVARMTVSLLIGPLIDRWSALRILPALLVPAICGLSALLAHDAPWIAFVYLIFAGLSQGMGGPLMTAVWAEMYGVESLGATKGTVATFGVLATALGPIILGIALDAGIGFDSMIGLAIAAAVVVLLMAWIGSRRVLASCSRESPRIALD
ncbi:MAG: MFS transporter [Verrucomicrobiales bacterium]